MERYWQLDYGPSGLTESALLERIDGLLDETVAMHLMSDVPVGAFLSGGLDSTLMASYAARRLGRELRTFSMGIPYRDLNELPGRGGGGRASTAPRTSPRRSRPTWCTTSPGWSRRWTSRRIRCRSACSTWPA